MAADTALKIHGWAAPGFEAVRGVAQGSLERGDDVGLSICAIKDGETIVDLWGGIADVTTETAWQRDTIINTYSVTKTMTALAALVLIDAGELHPDAPMTRYWPEFGAGGKDAVLVRHVLGHTSGVAGWQQPVSVADICDVQTATDLLAAQEPWWSPGEASGYHTINQGHLVGELVRRISGRSLGTFFAEQIAGPVGADFFIGTPASADERIATLIAPESRGIDYSQIPADSIVRKSLLNPAITLADIASAAWRRAEIGAANGHGNARSVAQLQSIVSTCGQSGPVSLRRATVDRIFEVQADGRDLVLGVPLRFGLGFALPSPASVPEVPDGRVCWWTGFGGSFVLNDLDHRLTIAYVMNKMSGALIGLGRAGEYVHAVYAALEPHA
jgi:CubicO group peptidase (beta-lactamase class C family)